MCREQFSQSRQQNQRAEQPLPRSNELSVIFGTLDPLGRLAQAAALNFWTFSPAIYRRDQTNQPEKCSRNHEVLFQAGNCPFTTTLLTCHVFWSLVRV